MNFQQITGNSLPPYQIQTKEDITEVIKQCCKQFTGLHDDDKTRRAMDSAIKATLVKYLPVGVDMDNLLKELEIDEMLEKLEALDL